MRQATTPTYLINIEDENGQPLDASIIADLCVSFKQGDTIVERRLKDCTSENGCYKVCLKREETCCFEVGEFVEIQAEVKTTDGHHLTTDIIYEVVEKAVNKGAFE